jgi:hypothetical protein
MASEGPPQSEDIVCVSVPCREGRERGWRAIELLHQEQRPQRPPLVPRPACRHATRPSRRAGGACNGRRCLPVSLQRHTNARRRLRAREICASRPWRPTALTCFRATSSLLTASVGHASIDQRWIADGLSQQKGRLRSFWSRRLTASRAVRRSGGVGGGGYPGWVRGGLQSLGASPEEQRLLQMQGVFTEYARALLQERPRRGRLFAARQGRVHWGNPPYGYTDVRQPPTTPQHLVIN